MSLSPFLFRFRPDPEISIGGKNVGGALTVWCLMLSGGLFFLDQFVNESRCGATAETARWLIFSFALWVTHEAFVERLFGSHEVIVIKRELAALAAL